MIPLTYDLWLMASAFLQVVRTCKNFIEAPQHGKASTLVFGEPSPMTHHLCGTPWDFEANPPDGIKRLTKRGYNDSMAGHDTDPGQTKPSWSLWCAKPLNPPGMWRGSLLMNLYWNFGVLVSTRQYLSNYFKTWFIYIQNHSDFQHQIITKSGLFGLIVCIKAWPRQAALFLFCNRPRQTQLKLKGFVDLVNPILTSSHSMNHSVLTLWHHTNAQYNLPK